jgi:hypothetical protein
MWEGRQKQACCIQIDIESSVGDAYAFNVIVLQRVRGSVQQRYYTINHDTIQGSIYAAAHVLGEYKVHISYILLGL